MVFVGEIKLNCISLVFILEISSLGSFINLITIEELSSQKKKYNF